MHNSSHQWSKTGWRSTVPTWRLVKLRYSGVLRFCIARPGVIISYDFACRFSHPLSGSGGPLFLTFQIQPSAFSYIRAALGLHSLSAMPHELTTMCSLLFHLPMRAVILRGGRVAQKEILSYHLMKFSMSIFPLAEQLTGSASSNFADTTICMLREEHCSGLPQCFRSLRIILPFHHICWIRTSRLRWLKLAQSVNVWRAPKLRPPKKKHFIGMHLKDGFVCPAHSISWTSLDIDFLT